MQIPTLHIAAIELPREFRRLYDMAYNYWWTWTPRARRLFAAIDSRAWAMYRTPVQMLLSFDRSRWREVLQGLIKPNQCEAFGKQCTPRTPLGAPMVSSEGACAAYYQFRRLEVSA